jgi:hypothetical protein
METTPQEDYILGLTNLTNHMLKNGGAVANAYGEESPTAASIRLKNITEKQWEIRRITIRVAAIFNNRVPAAICMIIESED